MPGIKTFAIDAPDMWAWRSAVLDFSVEKAGIVHEPARESSLMEGLPLKSRIKRINEIKEFLANKPEDLPASLSSSLLNELGRLFSSIGKYEVALKHFKESLKIWKETGNRREREFLFGTWAES
ncbi:MAG: tetratricopeptide repeat-containing protein [Nitrospinae bacterium]|nr:tetratricopeptide repeat-containing protein [Nitrospinota bacterium]